MTPGPAATSGGRLAGCTVATRRELSLVRALARSFLEHHPGSRFVVLLVDRVDGYFDPAREPFEVTPVESLGIADFPAFAFARRTGELCAALEPLFLGRLLADDGIGTLVFLDPDVLVLQPLTAALALLREASVVVTPRITVPGDAGRAPAELEVLRAGAWDPGFLALVNTATARELLAWWWARVSDPDLAAPGALDHRWTDLFPALAGGVRVLRDPAYAVACWNLHERAVDATDPAHVLVDGRPACVVHFARMLPDMVCGAPGPPARLTVTALGAAAGIFRHYRERVDAEGYAQTRTWPRAFERFSDGRAIPDAVRTLYRTRGEARRQFADPFRAGSPSDFREWLLAPVGEAGNPGSPVSRFWFEIYRERPDLQLAFPDVLGRDGAAFGAWIARSGRKEYGDEGGAAVATGAEGQRGPSGRTVLLAAERVARAVVGAVVPRDSRAAIRLRTARDRFLYRRAAGPAPPAPPAPPPTPFAEGVNVAAYFASEKGIGEAGRASVRALTAAHVPHALRILVDRGSANVETVEATSPQCPYGVNLIHVNPEQLPGVAEELGDALLRDRYNIGFWFWELSDFPEAWWPSFRYCDEIWVASSFVHDAIARVAPVPVVKVPLAIDPTLQRMEAADRARLGLPPDAFVFLTMFDLHSTAQRKNPLAVLQAFRMAFGDRPDAVLVLKAAHAGTLDEVARVGSAVGRAENVRVVDATLTRPELLALMATADCYVSLHRAEGFGLPLAEAMLLAKPVIATAYSATMDFTTPWNSRLVRYDLVEIEEDVGPYRKGYVWADPSPAHAAELMRWAFDHREQARALGARGRDDVLRQYHPQVAGARMKERLERVGWGRR